MSAMVDEDPFAPADGEAAVLSLIAVRQEAAWVAASGSLLTVPHAVASTSWPRWAARQPTADEATEDEGIDLGPTFLTDPFPGVRIVRAILSPGGWRELIAPLLDGRLETAFGMVELPLTSWSSTVLLGLHGATDAHGVVIAARRPVLARAAAIRSLALPRTQGIWQWPHPPHVPRGRDLAEMSRQRMRANWPRTLLGIGWSGVSEHPPPASFVIGRLHHEAWIARVRPDYKEDELVVAIAWDAECIDPLSCSLTLRNESDGLPVMSRTMRLSDLPSSETSAPEPRELPWDQRTLEVRLPRGPRRGVWGLALTSPRGELLDERPPVMRFESGTITLDVGGVPGPAHGFGDTRSLPTPAERDAAVNAARKLDESGRAAAAKRRISTTAELKDYLRWRFSCHAGELLICDPWLVDNDPAATIEFLVGLGRPIRGLARSVPPTAQGLLRAHQDIQIGALPQGKRSLHDRIWIVGATAVLVGTSPNLFLTGGGTASRATTAADLPEADARAWREQFEAWWRST